MGKPDKSMMTREEYQNWLKTRGPEGTWDLTACQRADRLIKTVALYNLDEKLKGLISDTKLRRWVFTIAQCHFGNGDVDDILTHLGCYEDWMDIQT